MSKINEESQWADEVYLIKRADSVTGGNDGVANRQAKALANRTSFLKVMLEGGIDYNESTFFITPEDPDGTIAGLAATPAGRMFRVAQGAENEDAFAYYLNRSGSAEKVAVSVGKMYMDMRLVPGNYSPALLPLHHDAAGNVPMWLDNSLFDAAGLGPVLQDCVAAIPNLWAQQHLRQFDFSPYYLPLHFDKDGNVPVWLDNAKLDAAGLGPILTAQIKEMVEDDKSTAFITGDLYKFLFKKARIDAGQQLSLNVAFTGDSWTEKNTLPLSLIKALGGVSKNPGWISCSTRADGVMAGITLAVTGFTKYDGDNESSSSAPLYGAGPDGNAYYNVNAVGTLIWSGVKATEIDLFYYDGSGSFTVTVDTGAPVTVTGGGTGKTKKLTLNGLASQAHTVRVQSSGNGVVSIFGMHGTDSGAAPGVTVSRMGNGGAIAKDYLKWSDWIAPVASSLDLDLLFIVIGTNDYRKSMGTAQYRSGIETIISKYRAATPGICICLVSPAQCSATGTPALSAYDEEMRLIAREQNVSYLSGYKTFPKAYDNSQGAWIDTLHLSSLGAYVLTRQIKDNFFKE
ncbi:SGNH/GDSL hydrolase family protein [Erwinia sp. E602]|nr:SGNH/GDSL hydrolase family protein [Erwinia sp. E602]